MSNIIYLYGHFEEKLPVDSSGCLGVASGYMMPILWAALFTLDNLIIEKKESEKPHYLIEVRLDSEAAIGNIGGVLELHTNSEIQPVTLIRIIGEIE